MLIENRLEGIYDRVSIAIERIKQFCPTEGYYLAFSGGKDSVVILDLAKRSGCAFDAHYSLTTVDPPEVVRFIKTFPEVSIDKPEKTMWELIVEKRLPPTRIVRYCCEQLKEKGGHGRTVITGVRWAESVRRKSRNMIETCFKDKSKRFLNVIVDWSDDDVWEYIRKFNVRYCELYDPPYNRKRIGCVMCPMQGSKKMQEDAERYPKIAQAYLRAIEQCYEKRITDGLKTDWHSGQEIYDWWIHGKFESTDKEKYPLFYE